ncbi:MAG: methyltransferase domain-containing protein [Acidimicrobiales bacterium]
MATAQGDGEYRLGNDPAELDRLERQAAILAPATSALLGMAGIRPGMRVLDLGTGPGDVALLAADAVAPGGAAVGIDQSPEALTAARERAAARGITNVSFIAGDVCDFHDDEPFDAVVGRLVLGHTPDPVAVIGHHAASLPAGGIVLAMEYDIPATRAVPHCPATYTATRWVVDAFERAGLDPLLGPRLGAMLRAAGFDHVSTIGIQPYLPPDAGAGMLAGIVRPLLPLIEQTGVTAAEVDIATLEVRLATEMRDHDAVLAYPTLAGAWAQTNED